jgi:hypothetical protein
LSSQTFTPTNSIQPNQASGQGHLDEVVQQINKLRISEDESSAEEINRNLEEQAVGGQGADHEKLDLGQHIMNNGVEIYADKLGPAYACLSVGGLQKSQPCASAVDGNGDDDRVADDLDWGPNFCSHPKQSGGRNSTCSHGPEFKTPEENELEENFPLTSTSIEGSDWDYLL